MRKRATRIAACVLAGVMAMQMTGCGNKKVDYTLDGESGSASGYSDDGSNDAGGSLAKSLGIPEKCDETFDVGNSGLSEISCSGSIDIPDTDSMKRVYYSTMKLDAAQIQSIVEGLLDKSQGIYIRKDGVQTKVSGYSVTLSRSIYGAKEREGELYNVDNLQTQNGYMFEPGDSVTLNIDDDGVVDMFAQLYTDPSSLQAEDVELMSWNDMIAKANEGIATYYEKYQTRYGKVQFNNVALRYMATADDDGKLCYIPAWIFTQSEELRGQDTLGEISQIICINAIDGSCIDIVDNAKKMKLWETY